MQAKLSGRMIGKQIIAASKDKLTEITGVDLINVLKQCSFNTSSKEKLIELVEAELSDLISSEKIFCKILKNLNGDNELHLQEIIIEEFAPHIKSWQDLKQTLKTLAQTSNPQETFIQEKLLSALNSRFAQLKGADERDKASILKMLKDPVFEEIINEAFKLKSPQRHFLSRLFKPKPQSMKGIDNFAYDNYTDVTVSPVDKRPQLKSR